TGDLRFLCPFQPALRGMLRWTLHKKIDQNPSSSSILVRILVKELERAERGDYRHYIIPLLHTLMYTLIKAPCISDELCSRVYDFCKKLLTLPKPFCTIGLDYAVRLKMERAAPGMLYQRMVISEQSLKSNPYPYQEKIFIFADPELLSEAICNALVTDTQAAQLSQSPRVCMCYVIIHAMQAALCEGCDLSGLRMSLQVSSSTSTVEHWFHQVVAAVECAGSEASVDREQHVERLEKIYCALLGSLPPAPFFPPGDAPLGRLQDIPLPNPNISFHLWKEDDQLCEWELDTKGWLVPAQSPPMGTPLSPSSAPGGFEKLGAFLLPVVLGPGGERGGCLLVLQSCCREPFSSPFTSETRLFLLSMSRKRETRRVFLTPRLNLQFYYIPVVTGQPSAPTAAVSPELCEVAGYLGRADPWYESNINTLCHMIPKLATMPSSPSKHLVTDLFITDVIAYYVRMGAQPVCFQVYAVKVFFNDPALEPAEDVFLTELCAQVQESISHRGVCFLPVEPHSWGCHPGGVSPAPAPFHPVLSLQKASDRAKEVSASLRSTGLVMKAIPADEAEAPSSCCSLPLSPCLKHNLLCLNVNVTEIIKINNLSGRSFSAVANRLKTRDIKIRSTEQRPFMVCLDKDSRRTYRNVISVEVSPCLEPSYCLQKTRTMKSSVHEAEDVGLVKYMPKSLLLPINTFAGVIQ
uniref:Phosphoinositide-3-kinase regulatory subunit 6 n=1 Tax=Cairina moschata TaxID=8855 RepID=A0A8C3CUN3_CAIMO